MRTFLIAIFTTSAFAIASISVAAQDVTETDEATQELLRSVFANYRAVETYQATPKMTMDMEVKDAPEIGQMMGATDQVSTVRFQRPDRLFFQSDQILIVLDRDTLRMGYPMMKQYVEQAVVAGDQSGWQMIEMMTGGSGLLIEPLSAMRADETDAEKFVAALKNVTMKKIEVDGKRRVQISATIPSDLMGMAIAMGDHALPAEIWIDPERKLITRYTIDVTEAMNAMMEDMAVAQDDAMQFMGNLRYEKMVVINDLSDQHLGVELNEDALTYDWEANGYEKTDQNMLGGMFQANASPLLGEAAPDINSETIEREPFTLSDLRGNVVVLDFWATWCGPCVQALPKIQKLHEEFAGKDVRVIGINQDRGNLEVVKQFLEKKKITFTQVKDSENAIGTAYEVTGIPLTVIIDQEGVVQAMHVGYMPGQEKTLREEVNTLLEGRSLLTEEQKEQAKDARADRKEARKLEGREDTGRTSEFMLTEHEPQRLKEAETIRSVTIGYGAIVLDLDADGRDELLMPSTRANFEVRRSDGSTELLQLQGLPLMQQVQFRLIDLNGEKCLAAFAQGSDFSGSTTLTIGVWHIDGRRVWSTKKVLPRGTSVTYFFEAANITGDQSPELILAFEKFEFDSSAQTTFKAPTNRELRLAVYSADGELLALRNLEGSIFSMHIMEDEYDQPGIFLITDRGVTQFRFDENAPPE